FNPKALVYHWKPRPKAGDVEKMIRQARAQARTAVQLAQIHPHWRTYLATGINPVNRGLHKWIRGIQKARDYVPMLAQRDSGEPLSNKELRAARSAASAAYYDELERALQR
ncbi:MAG TPA: hypothetical protein VFN49_05040, partial [Candidatus Aquilonibacter sp.]|nr:hypothetical protein [Candidatus Aquilonibacter sp.]